MSIIDFSTFANDIASASDAVLLPSGTETDLRIVSVRQGTSTKRGEDMSYFQIYFDVPDVPEVDQFSEFFWGPDALAKLEPKELKQALRKIKSAQEATGTVWTAEFDLDNLRGTIIRAVVGQYKPKDGAVQQTINKWLTA